MIGLTLGAVGALRTGMAVPTRPLLIPSGPGEPRAFADVEALARFIQRRRRGRGIELKASVATYRGSDTFPILTLSWLNMGDEPEYFGALAVQGLGREAFELALKEAERGVRPFPLGFPRSADLPSPGELLVLS